MNEQKNDKWSYWHWVSVLVLNFFGLGTFSFIPPLIINGIVPEYEKTDLFRHNYNDALNYFFTNLILGIIFVVWCIASISILFLFELVDEVMIMTWFLLIGLGLLICCLFSMYYFVIGIVAAIKAYNNEYYRIPLLVRFLK